MGNSKHLEELGIQFVKDLKLQESRKGYTVITLIIPDKLIEEIKKKPSPTNLGDCVMWAIRSDKTTIKIDRAA